MATPIPNRLLTLKGQYLNLFSSVLFPPPNPPIVHSSRKLLLSPGLLYPPDPWKDRIIDSNLNPWLLALQACCSCIPRQLTISPPQELGLNTPADLSNPYHHHHHPTHTHYLCNGEPLLGTSSGPHPVTHFFPSGRLYISAKPCPFGKGLDLSPVWHPSPKPLVYLLASLDLPRGCG